MSDTPRTDGAVFVVFSSPSNDVEAVDADFARELERENAALKAKVEVIVQNYEDYKAENAALNETARKHVAAYYELLDENTALRKQLKEAKP